MVKPLYKIPLMEEINKISHNGYYVVSTFSGCGGSSLGYKMSGFKVLWANEFIPEAQKTYEQNHKGTFLDKRDIRIIKPEEILQQINKKKGELDLLDGSPPCSSFSVAGKISKGWGKEKSYSDLSQRTDDLFYEYIRILRGLMPKCFIAENVKGLTIGKSKGMFLEFLNSFKNSGYNVKASILNAKYLGVPQSRERVIFFGVREDFNIAPVFPKPLPYFYTFGDAVLNLKDEVKLCRYLKIQSQSRRVYDITLPGEMFSINNEKVFNNKSMFTHSKCSYNKPIRTLTTTSDQYHPKEARTLSIAEIKRCASFPDDFITTGNFRQQWERIGRSVPPVMMKHIALSVKEVLDKIK